MIMTQHNTFFTALTESTAELIERYADTDQEGYIRNFQIINKEIISALNQAKEWLCEGLLGNEVLSEVWYEENPCDSCAEQKSCTITCRRKHAFDRAIYGGLLCGAQAAILQKNWGSEEVKNKVHFKVRLGANTDSKTGLFFERDLGYSEGGISVKKNGEISINGKQVLLRPWSATLYTLFVLHPEGFPLSELAGEREKELVKKYRNISKSEVKVAKLKSQLTNPDNTTRLFNNKLSELNTQLKEAGIPQLFWVTTTSHKANNKPYFIPYLQEKK